MVIFQDSKLIQLEQKLGSHASHLKVFLRILVIKSIISKIQLSYKSTELLEVVICQHLFEVIQHREGHNSNNSNLLHNKAHNSLHFKEKEQSLVKLALVLNRNQDQHHKLQHKVRVTNHWQENQHWLVQMENSIHSLK